VPLPTARNFLVVTSNRISPEQQQQKTTKHQIGLSSKQVVLRATASKAIIPEDFNTSSRSYYFVGQEGDRLTRPERGPMLFCQRLWPKNNPWPVIMKLGKQTSPTQNHPMFIG
jgi:hypothetical protein